MAIANLNTDIVIAQDGASAFDGGGVDSEKFYSNGGSVGFTLTNGTLTISNGSGMATYDTHLRIRISHGALSFLGLEADGGVKLWATDGANTAYWTVMGRDTWSPTQGEWVYLVTHTQATVDAGSSALTGNITDWGVEVYHSTRAGNKVNIWIDMFAYGNYIEAFGGTSGDPITLADISDADYALGYGVLSLNKKNGNIDVTGGLRIGASAETTYFEADLATVKFNDYVVSASLYEFIAVAGTLTSIIMSGGTLQGYNRKFKVDSIGADTWDFTGVAIVNANTVDYKSGDNISGCTFDSCGLISPTLASFDTNTIKNSTETTSYALFMEKTHNISKTSYLDNYWAIGITPATDEDTYTEDGGYFTGNTADIYNTHATNDVSITKANNSGISTSATAGGVVTIDNGVVVSITIIDESLSPIISSGVKVVATQTAGTVTVGDILYQGRTDTNGKCTFSINYEGAWGDGLSIKTTARQKSYPPVKQTGNAVGAISSTGYTNTITLLGDE